LSSSVSRTFAFLCIITATTSICADAQNPATTVTVDAAVNRHAINPNIYGVAYGDATTLADLHCPINRYGGNNSTRYNWQINADNRGSDWYFESIGDASAVAGERGDSFFSMSRSAGAQAMLTVPMIGWVAKLGVNRNKLASFSIQKYGAQTGNDWQWFPDAGNGVLSATGQYVTNNAFTDANIQVDSTYQQGWVQHLVNAWGTAANGGVNYYLLDNEDSIWFATHRDVHPAGPTMDEIKTRIVDYAGKIKMADPTALVVGPEEWGWSGYFFSGADQQWGSQNGWSNLPDRANHGGQDYLPWLLAQLKQAAGTGQRFLDVFSVHYYPQGGEFGNDTSTATQLLRNRSTRSLWDPNYIDQSWINDKVQLIPRLKNWVNTYYFANTPVAITEYNWGAESHINGATAQADIFGIFGREGLDLAARWTTPDPATPVYKAMKMYRNYDGAKSGFGDTSVSAAVANPDNLSAFAAIRSTDGALTVMVIDKVLSGNTPVTLALNNFAGSGTAHVYQLTASNAIQQLPDATYSGANLGLTVPAQSITLLILPKAAGALPPSLTVSKTHSGSFTQGQQSGTYTVTVSNSGGAGPTSGTVTVTEAVPSGLTLVSLSGAGWTCPGTASNNCIRNDVLNAGASYPSITVTVNVAANATSPQVNSVTVSGGGSSSANTTDSTNITTSSGASGSKGAVFRNGLWVIDLNGNFQWDGPGIDRAMVLGQAGDIPVTGDWNGDGRRKAGIFRNGMWVLDYNGNGQWDGPSIDKVAFLGQAGDIPLVGDWNGSGTSKIGVFRNGLWVLDYNGNFQWDGTAVDRAMALGQAGDIPVVGDWNGSGTSKGGVFRNGLWVLDYNGNFQWDGTAVDRAMALGQAGDIPVVGDWNGSGTAKGGVFRNGLWVLDYNGNFQWDGPSVDVAAMLGQGGDVPVVGDWNGSGSGKIGIFRNGLWVFDYNGNFQWDGTTIDRAMALGQVGDVPMPAKW
jgi:uncharacterized repeat protein (TIGR01451 family)